MDPDVAEMLATLAALRAPALSEGTVAEARANYDVAPKPVGDPLARVEDQIVPGPAGDIPVRLYAATRDTGLPIVVFFHGGGWVLSSVAGHDPIARRIAARSEALVVSVEPAQTHGCAIALVAAFITAQGRLHRLDQFDARDAAFG